MVFEEVFVFCLVGRGEEIGKISGVYGWMRVFLWNIGVRGFLL